MDATAEDIEAALFAALERLKVHPPVTVPPTPPGPYILVERYAGEVTPEGVDNSVLGKAPAALLAWEGAVPEGANGVWQEDGGHNVQVVERHHWSVFVVVKDTRGDAQALNGTVGLPGVLRCTRLVKEALVGLRVPGLFDGDVVRLVETRPKFIRRGTAYCYVVRLSTRAALPATMDEHTRPEGSVPLGGVRGSVPDATRDNNGAEVTLGTFNTLPDA